MGFEQVVESVTIFVLIATIVGFAYENVSGVILSTDNREDDIKLLIAVLICVVFDITLIEDIASVELAENGPPQGFAVTISKIRPWLDNVISGSAMAGGGAALLKKLKRARAEVARASK
jgi:hypothetical protein